MDNLKKEIAIFGGGCFWCLDALFRELRGVTQVFVGYAGGQMQNPKYTEVCSGATGHAEVIKIEFYPKIISYKDLLTVFFAAHDPSTLNKQGADVGTQYRSVVLYNSEAQKQEVQKFIEELNKVEGGKVVTQVSELEKFYQAEEYHQNYFKKNPDNPYCQIVINPKLKHLQEKFSQLINK